MLCLSAQYNDRLLHMTRTCQFTLCVAEAEQWHELWMVKCMVLNPAADQAYSQCSSSDSKCQIHDIYMVYRMQCRQLGTDNGQRHLEDPAQWLNPQTY